MGVADVGFEENPGYFLDPKAVVLQRVVRGYLVRTIRKEALKD